LRHFRDTVLNQTPTGQEITKLYYQLTPAILKALEDDEEFKKEARETADGILDLMKEGPD